MRVKMLISSVVCTIILFCVQYECLMGDLLHEPKMAVIVAPKPSLLPSGVVLFDFVAAT